VVVSPFPLSGRSGVGVATVWGVRAGEDLKFLPLFVSEDVVGIGWAELPRSQVGLSRPELEGMLQATYPDASPSTIANNTG
jgi:predicted Mrr-cat superfamily restriction endonuclease